MSDPKARVRLHHVGSRLPADRRTDRRHRTRADAAPRTEPRAQLGVERRSRGRLIRGTVARGGTASVAYLEFAPMDRAAARRLAAVMRRGPDRVGTDRRRASCVGVDSDAGRRRLLVQGAHRPVHPRPGAAVRDRPTSGRRPARRAAAHRFPRRVRRRTGVGDGGPLDSPLPPSTRSASSRSDAP